MIRRAWVSASLVLAACSTPARPPPATGSGRPDDAPAGSSKTVATLALVGGIVHTLDGGKSATAIAISGDRILAVGSDEQIQALTGPSTKLIGLGGRTVVPGLADAHMHVFGLGERGRNVDLVGTKSIKDVQDRVATAAKSASPGAWIQGRGWDQNDWGKLGAFPSARDLDSVTGDHPTVLERVDGHALWANTAALKAAGIGPESKDPPGGRIIRSGAQPSGVFIDNAMPLVASAMPPPSTSDLRRAYFLGEREALKAGLTQVQDMGLGRAELSILRELDKAGELKIRVYALVDGGVEDLDSMLGSGPQIPEKASKSRLTVRGVKFFLDGALGSRGAALLAPYDDEPKSTGLVTMDENLYEARVRTCKERGYQVATHAIGDRANRLALDVYERVFGRAAKERPRIEHAQVIARDDIVRFGDLGVIASMQPTHATSDLPWAGKRIGAERLKGAYAWRSLQVAGATIASGSDAPVEDPMVVAGLYSAIFRQSPDEFMAEPWSPEERMNPVQAVRSFSTNAAYASFREADAGKIVAGWTADLTVLDFDPFTADAVTVERGKIELTIVGGELAYIKPGADRLPEPKAPPKPATPPPAPVAPVKTATTASVKTSTSAR